MSSHWGIKYGVYFNTEEEAAQAIPELVKNDPARWVVFGCNCDEPTRAERLAMYFPRLFGWLVSP